jgi:hypothetical protein
VIEKFTTPEKLPNLAPGLGVPTFSKNISFIAIAESHDSARAALQNLEVEKTLPRFCYNTLSNLISQYIVPSNKFGIRVGYDLYTGCVCLNFIFEYLRYFK